MRMPWQRASRPYRPDQDDDGDVEAVIFRNLWKNHRLFPPHSPLKGYWDTMMFIFVIYNSVYIPINIALFNLSKPLGQCIFDVLVDILFIVDMLLNLRTTYYDDEGELVLDKRAIYKKYLCSHWFAIDFLAVFPFDLIASTANGDGWTCGLESQSDDLGASVIKLLKALRLLRLVRFRKEMDRLKGANALRVIVSLSGFVLVAHWLACIWWAIGYFEYKADESTAEQANVSVVCDNSHQCSWLRRLPAGCEPLSPSSDFAVQYWSAIFWSLTTLMKTPWVGPDTVAEKIFATLAIFAGAICYAYFLGTVQGSYASYNKAASAKRDKMSNLNAFLNVYSIPSELGQKLQQHTAAQAAWLPLGLVDSQVLMQLPSHLRGMVALEMHQECGGPSAMFPSVSIEAAKSLVMRLHTQLVMADQVLISKNEVCSNLYFLAKGAVRVTVDPPLTAAAIGQPLADASRRSSTEGAASATSRMSLSRKGFGGAREIDRPGTSVGLVEPIDPKWLGLYPAWVSASKKTLMLRITQREIGEALDGFGGDVEPLREALLKQHTALVESLKVTPSDDSPAAMCAAGVQYRQQRETESKKAALSEEDTARVSTVEASVHDSMVRVLEMKNDMEALPRILKLIDDATDKGVLNRLKDSHD